MMLYQRALRINKLEDQIMTDSMEVIDRSL